MNICDDSFFRSILRAACWPLFVNAISWTHWIYIVLIYLSRTKHFIPLQLCEGTTHFLTAAQQQSTDATSYQHIKHRESLLNKGFCFPVLFLLRCYFLEPLCGEFENVQLLRPRVKVSKKTLQQMCISQSCLPPQIRPGDMHEQNATEIVHFTDTNTTHTFYAIRSIWKMLWLHTNPVHCGLKLIFIWLNYGLLCGFDSASKTHRWGTPFATEPPFAAVWSCDL